jgi:hypothetical protein
MMCRVSMSSGPMQYKYLIITCVELTCRTGSTRDCSIQPVCRAGELEGGEPNQRPRLKACAIIRRSSARTIPRCVYGGPEDDQLDTYGSPLPHLATDSADKDFTVKARRRVPTSIFNSSLLHGCRWWCRESVHVVDWFQNRSYLVDTNMREGAHLPLLRWRVRGFGACISEMPTVCSVDTTIGEAEAEPRMQVRVQQKKAWALCLLVQ